MPLDSLIPYITRITNDFRTDNILKYCIYFLTLYLLLTHQLMEKQNKPQISALFNFIFGIVTR